jgi:preprotein translocase subunit SecB
MKLSPLQLVRYLVPEVACVANAAYDDKKPSDLSETSFKAESQIHPLESKSPDKYSSWSVELDLSQDADEKANVPYHFNIKLVGLFRCNNKEGNVPAEVFVRTNGSSILYGIARETLRSLTSVGPWGDMLLPTVSFYASEALPEKAGVVEKAKPRKAGK